MPKLLNYTDLESQLRELHSASQWYVGFSGGIDSTVLLHLLHEWCAANPDAPTLSAIHINHGMQSSANEWQRHCEEICRSLQLVLRARPVEVHATGTGEAAAREERYRAFTEQLDPNAVLFLGHHLDDQVETFFLRLMRGAGVEGLVAMPRSRALGEGQLVRPLLDFGRAEIESYAVQHGLAHVEDPSNQSTDMDRNFLAYPGAPVAGFPVAGLSAIGSPHQRAHGCRRDCSRGCAGNRAQRDGRCWSFAGTIDRRVR